MFICNLMHACTLQYTHLTSNPVQISLALRSKSPSTVSTRYKSTYHLYKSQSTQLLSTLLPIGVLLHHLEAL